MKIRDILNVLIEQNVYSKYLKTFAQRQPKKQKEYILKNLERLGKKLDEYYLKLEKDKKYSEVKHKAKMCKLPIKKFMELESIWNTVAKNICYSMGYSMGSNVIIRYNHTTVGSYNTCTTYAKSCKYKPTHGYFNLDLTKEQFTQTVIIGGIPTILGKQVTPKIRECKILNTVGVKQHFKMVWNNFYITQNFHGLSIEDCQNWRDQRVKLLLEQRSKQQDKNDILEKAKKKYIGLQHSLSVGNCEVGTKSFANRYQLNLDMGYNLAFIISLEDSPYTRRLLTLI